MAMRYAINFSLNIEIKESPMVASNAAEPSFKGGNWCHLYDWLSIANFTAAFVCMVKLHLSAWLIGSFFYLQIVIQVIIYI